MDHDTLQKLLWNQAIVVNLKATKSAKEEAIGVVRSLRKQYNLPPLPAYNSTEFATWAADYRKKLEVQADGQTPGGSYA